MKLQSVTQTAFPNGDVIKYAHGMPKPDIKDLSEAMKKAAMNEAIKRRKSA